MGSGAKQMLRDEIISIYVGANVILGALVDLGLHLSKDQIGGILVIGNVVVGPVVRHFTNTTPSSTDIVAWVAATKDGTLAAPLPHADVPAPPAEGA